MGEAPLSRLRASASVSQAAPCRDAVWANDDSMPCSASWEKKKIGLSYGRVLRERALGRLRLRIANYEMSR